ncbi:class II fructose-bisphosphate aldolase [Cohnella boryungensis]|uniref:Ketose-bisphosphate aldolase n=1 Tax=Cohnella boryungensis TaxID=768479 RepID=A0ABV8S4K8_9BACL
MNPLVPMTHFLPKAKKEKFAVGQFNVITLEFADIVATVAEEENAPVIFGAGEMSIKYMGLDYCVAVAKLAASKVSVPVALHLDHGSSFEVAMKCIQAGFSSVMFDGSKYPLEENIRLTKQVVAAAHAVGVSVEAELGSIGGTEDDHTVDEADAALVKPEEAIYFWNETKVDAMAIAVGSAHGMYKREPNIRTDIIEKVANAIDVSVVLHGGSGIPDDAIRNSITAGIGKINVNTENLVAYTAAVRKFIASNDTETDPRKYQGPAREAMKDVIRSKIRLFGSNNKA